MKVYITKYALTKGIQEMNAEEDLYRDADLTRVAVHGPAGYTYFHGEDWHRERGRAVARVEEMKRRKIASLKKKLRELEEMIIE